MNSKKAYNVYYTYLINRKGKKGVKIRRIEEVETGKELDIRDFISKYKLDPKLFNADFIGQRGMNVYSLVFSKTVEI